MTPREKAKKVHNWITGVDAFMDYFRLVYCEKGAPVRKNLARLLRKIRRGDPCTRWEVCYFVVNNYGHLRPNYQIEFGNLLNDL